MVTRRIASLLAATAACAVMIYAGCGGKAVIDGDPDGGAGGVGAAGPGPGPGPGPGQGGSPNPGPGPNTTTNVGVGGGSLCQQACSLVDECLADPGSCVARCEDEIDCPSSHNSFLTCLIDELDTNFPCDLPDGCIQALNSYVDCIGSESFQGNCFEKAGTCSCDLFDFENNSYQTTCTPSSNDTLCQCVENGVFEGSCTTPNFEQCSPIDDCCATLFFLP
jgi:hypothetical protein